MKQLLMIAHAFHEKTNSHVFLLDLFRPCYEISICYLDPYSDSGRDALGPFKGSKFDLVLCWQMLPPLRMLKRIPAARTVVFPMYDSCGDWGIERWFPYRHLRIISFSETLRSRLAGWGFDVHGVTFFPPPRPEFQPGDPESVFFWNRTEKIDFPLVAALLESSNVKAIHLHRSLDPNQSFHPPTVENRKRYRISTSEWFDSRFQLEERMAASAFYIAPRVAEGIGMSFLEAMAMGRCVIAPDRPTMNEYITHGKTGYLFDPKCPKLLDVSESDQIQPRTLAFMTEGHRQWELDKTRIVPLCEAAPKDPAGKIWRLMLVRIAFSPLQASREWRRRLLSVRLRHGTWRIGILGRVWSGPRPPDP